MVESAWCKAKGKKRAITTVMRVITIMTVFLFAVILIGCEEGSEENEKELSGVETESVEAEYDGDTHGVKITGTEEGDVISYSTDGETWTETEPRYSEAGVYTVYVKVERSGYKPKIMQATVEIRRAIISGITARDMRIVYDGEAHEPVIEGVNATDRITYSLDGEEYGEGISITEIGAYTVYYRVERGKAQYSDSCRMEIVPNILGKYYNEESGEIIEITEGTEYDFNGHGTVNGQEFNAENNVVTVNGKIYNKIPEGKEVYRITVNGKKVTVIGGERIEVEITFDKDGATVTAEEETLRIEGVNYCESVTSAEIERSYETSDVKLILEESARIELSKRKEQ